MHTPLRYLASLLRFSPILWGDDRLVEALQVREKGQHAEPVLPRLGQWIVQNNQSMQGPRQTGKALQGLLSLDLVTPGKGRRHEVEHII